MLLLVSGATKTVERLKSHPHLGHLVSPRSRNDPNWFLSTGLPWAADNGAFSGFDPPAFLRMLDVIQGKPGCLFVVCPDVVGNAIATLSLFGQCTRPSQIDSCRLPTSPRTDRTWFP
jgi:hypothetical protein